MITINQIFNDKNSVLQQKILPNVIHNRFDLLYGEDYDLYALDGMGIIPVKIEKNFAHLGLYLTNFPVDELKQFFDFLFTKYKNIECLQIKHCYTNVVNAESYPYWHIDLPKTMAEFDATLAPRVRYNTKWYPKKIREFIGNYEIKKYTTNELTEQMVKTYLSWKKDSHGFLFNGTPLDYLKYAGITEGYVMFIDNEILAIGFICDTGDNAYFENFAHNPSPESKKYSVGMVLYYHIISDMVALGKTRFYLSGGWLDYKKWYNGVLTYTYSGEIYNKNYRHGRHSFWWYIKEILNKLKGWTK